MFLTSRAPCVTLAVFGIILGEIAVSLGNSWALLQVHMSSVGCLRTKQLFMCCFVLFFQQWKPCPEFQTANPYRDLKHALIFYECTCRVVPLHLKFWFPWSVTCA